MSFHSFFFFLMIPPPPRSTLFPYTTLFRSHLVALERLGYVERGELVASGGRPSQSYRLSQKGYDLDRKSTRLNSSHVEISYAVFCLKKKIKYRAYLEP